MKTQIVLCMTLTAVTAFAQPPAKTPPSPPPPAGAKIGTGSSVQSHSSEPIIIGDGSVKLSFYGGVTSPDGRTLIADAGKTTHSATFLVANGVDFRGQVKTATGVQPSATVLSYRYEVEAWNAQQHKWLPYASIDFSAFKDASLNSFWRISPNPLNALDLVQDGPKNTTPPGYPNHTLTKYEYHKGELRLRIGWAWVNGVRRFPLATGCSAYRIEPADHQGHTLPPPEHPCPTKRAIAGKTYANFDAGLGLKAIDVSLDLK